VIGYGTGSIPQGDAALCGMILTGKSFLKGNRLRADWQRRLTLEIRRFWHRTSKLSVAYLGYAIEGRTTEIQERFFRAMEKDYETLGDLASQEVLHQDDYPGSFFLLGVLTALEIIRTDTPLGETSISTNSVGKRISKIQKS
jgi:hypothetical protein